MHVHDRADFIPLPRRPRLSWPNGARLAVWVVPNIEYYDPESLAGLTIATVASEPPDIPNHTWREYGQRVGIWRTMRTLDSLGIRGTVALNGQVCEAYPEVVEACVERGWELMGHNWDNTNSLPGMAEAKERDIIGRTLSTIERTAGRRPTGWLGTGLAETSRTLEILVDNGVEYVGDWVNDEQPYPLRTASGPIVSMPYSIEINDIGIFMRRGFTGPQYGEMLRDQFDVLYDEAAETAKVMCIALHPPITGVPFRAKHLEEALRYMTQREGVWFATGSEILAAYQAAVAVPA
jgi:allantoinase